MSSLSIILIFLSVLSHQLATAQPVDFPTINAIPDPQIEVTAVFGNGQATATDSPGLAGSIKNPCDNVFDVTENYLYATDSTGGGLLRKIAVTNEFSSPFTALYYVKSIFNG